MNQLNQLNADFAQDGISMFIGKGLPLALLVVTASLKFIGKNSWPRSLLSAFAVFLIYPFVIGLIFYAAFRPISGDGIQSELPTNGVPMLLGVGLALLAWLGAVAVLCKSCGKQAGVLTGLLVVPLMWILCFGNEADSLGWFERRGSAKYLDVFGQEDPEYSMSFPKAEQPGGAWNLALTNLDYKVAEKFILAGTSVNTPVTGRTDSEPQSPLNLVLKPWCAGNIEMEPEQIRRRRSKMALLLLKHGADVNPPFSSSENLLELAISAATDPVIVKALLDAGSPMSTTQPPLHSACGLNIPDEQRMVALLLEAGCDPNESRASDQRTPLQCAAAHGTVETIQLLISKGASVRPPFIVNPEESPVILALLNYRPDNALALVENGADPHVRTTGGLSAWQLNSDPALRRALEAKGVGREVLFYDFVPANGADFGDLMMDAYSSEKQIAPVFEIFTAKLQGVGPWDLRLHFPEDPDPVRLVGVTKIQFQDLISDGTGDGKLVQNTVFLGDLKSATNLKIRAMERMGAISKDTKSGYSVTFYFEKQEAEKSVGGK